MSGILNRLGLAPHQYACMFDTGAIDMSELVLLTPFSRNNLEGFCAQINRMIEQSLCVINGYYGEVARQSVWRFWVPIFSLHEEVAEVMFSIGKDSEGIATYTLCFHGDLGNALRRCVLFSCVNDTEYAGATHLAHPVPHAEDQGCAGRYTLYIKGSTDHTLELCPDPNLG